MINTTPERDKFKGSYDFEVAYHGTIALVMPQHLTAERILENTAPDDAQFFGKGMAVEPGYLGGVVEFLTESGWRVKF